MTRTGPVHLVAGEGCMCGLPLEEGMHGVFTIGGTTCPDCLLLVETDPNPEGVLWLEFWAKVRAAVALLALCAAILVVLAIPALALFELVVP